MNCTMFFLLVALIGLILCKVVTAGSFVAPPENVTVYSGQMARFTCQITQSGLRGIYWFITEEGLLPYDLEDFYQARKSFWSPEGFDDPQTSSIALDMIGISETDNTLVECAGFYWNGENIFSDRVYLRVQGILDAPSNLASTIVNDSVLITWDPPSTLPGTTMSFAINASIGDHSETFTTSQHNFLVGLCDLGVSGCYSNCELNVSVRSVNQAGEGERASITVPVQPFSCDGVEQERLGPPTDLVGSAMDDSLSVSWSHPSSSHAIYHYSVDVWDTQTESPIANGIETSDLKHTLLYTIAGIDTCNKSYDVLISVCGVNSAGKGETANTTLAIQQNIQSCPSIPATAVESVTTLQVTGTSTHFSSHVPKDLMPYLIGIASGVTVVLLIVVAASVGACIWVTRRNERDYDSKPPSIETGKNPSYGDAPSLIRNPCYEEAPHVYEPIGPISNTVGEVAIGPHPKGGTSLMYPAHENA